MKSKPGLSQKALLVFLGLCLAVFFFEIALRLAGLTITALQDYRNRLALEKEGSYRILCLGESTTYDQYTPFLAASLNQNNEGIKFIVLDEGRIATNTSIILRRVESLLDHYKPDMVVAMMGINDGRAPHVPYENPSKTGFTPVFTSFKTYKFIRLLGLHLSARTNAADPRRLRGNGSTVRTKAEFRKAVELNFRDGSAYIELGRLYAERGQFAPAKASYKRALEINPRNGLAYIGFGELHLTRGEFSRAESSYRRSLKLDPGNEAVHVALGRLYRVKGQVLLSEANYRAALKANPRNEKAYAGLGWLYRFQKNAVLAEASFQKVLELNPENGTGHVGLASLYRDLGQMARAEASFETALRFHPNEGSAYVGLGWLYKEHGQKARAKANFEKALELNPRDGAAHVGLGWLYISLDQSTRAVTCFERALEISPNYGNAYSGLKKIYRKRGQIERAEAYAVKALALQKGLGAQASIDEDYKPTNDPTTVRNYQVLKKILDGRKIRLVGVQYPMRSIESLKAFFARSWDNIIFVDNEKSFKDAVRRDGYAAYFIDRFGGDFGHCSEKGNRLLGENIANAILGALIRK